jgi:tetratricopeptide (TPR) repeat protein
VLAALVAAGGPAACGGTRVGGGAKTTVAERPANPQAVARMAQGAQAMKDGATDRAVSLLREAIALDPSLWEARYDLGVALARAGDLAGAAPELDAAHRRAPDVEDVTVALAEVRRRRGENAAAAELLGEHLQSHPQADTARRLYVMALRDAGQFDKAIAAAREVLLRKPADASALSELALCHLARGERDVAELLVKQALDADAQSAAAHRAHGLVLLAAGEDAQAFQAFLKAAQHDPRDTTARENMGVVLLRAGAYAKAEDQYRAALAVAPDDEEAMVGLAAALRGQADKGNAKLDEAQRLLERALTRDPHNVAALYNLGVLCFEFLHRPEEGQTYMRRFLSDAPEAHPARAEATRYLAAEVAPAAPAAPPTPAAPAAAGGAK